MSRLTIPTRESAPAASRKLLDAVERQLGVVPNLFRLVGQSPAALEGLLSLNGALSASFDVATRERIALAVAQLNACDYCLSAHTYLGLNVAKLDEQELARNRAMRSSDPKVQAALRFIEKVVLLRGAVTVSDIRDIRQAGYSEAQVIELVGLVALNTFMNYVNNVARTDIDFPAVQAAAAA
jgi:uncharacterized peroxidase-related enzyme